MSFKLHAIKVTTNKSKFCQQFLRLFCIFFFAIARKPFNTLRLFVVLFFFLLFSVRLFFFAENYLHDFSISSLILLQLDISFSLQFNSSFILFLCLQCFNSFFLMWIVRKISSVDLVERKNMRYKCHNFCFLTTI